MQLKQQKPLKIIPTVIIARDNPWIGRIIKSVQAQEVPQGYMVMPIIALNGCDSGNKLAKSIRTEFPNIELLIDKPPGKPASWNHVMRLAKERGYASVVFLDSDVYIPGDFAFRLYSYLEEHSDAYVSCSRAVPLKRGKHRSLQSRILERMIFAFRKLWVGERICGRGYAIKVCMGVDSIPHHLAAEDTYLNAYVKKHAFTDKIFVLDLDVQYLPDESIAAMCRRIKRQALIDRRIREEFGGSYDSFKISFFHALKRMGLADMFFLMLGLPFFLEKLYFSKIQRHPVFQDSWVSDRETIPVSGACMKLSN